MRTGRGGDGACTSLPGWQHWRRGKSRWGGHWYTAAGAGETQGPEEGAEAEAEPTAGPFVHPGPVLLSPTRHSPAAASLKSHARCGSSDGWVGRCGHPVGGQRLKGRRAGPCFDRMARALPSKAHKTHRPSCVSLPTTCTKRQCHKHTGPTYTDTSWCFRHRPQPPPPCAAPSAASAHPCPAAAPRGACLQRGAGVLWQRSACAPTSDPD